MLIGSPYLLDAAVCLNDHRSGNHLGVGTLRGLAPTAIVPVLRNRYSKLLFVNFPHFDNIRDPSRSVRDLDYLLSVRNYEGGFIAPIKEF